jgi:Trypsin-like peptidase domain/AAA ATPase domain
MTGRILSDGRDAGTGFALAPRTVLTAGHVVRGRDAATLEFAADTDPPVGMEDVELAEEIDVAVLRLRGDTRGLLTVGRAIEGTTWAIDARPRSNDPRLTGVVTATRRRFTNARGHEVEGVQLQVTELLEDYQGYSGSPVTSPDGAAVAILVEQVQTRGAAQLGERGHASNVLYAIPIEDALARFGVRAGGVDGRRSLTAGMSADQAVPVGNFLTQYLGTIERPALFAGRDHELAVLDAWLVEEGAPPFMLIAAPPGRGKSALVTQWATRLTDRGTDVAFVPVSIRFRTNEEAVVFGALAARLAYLVGRASAAGEGRGAVADHLTRPAPRPLVVILDGVDEASGWEAGPDLFPAAPASGIWIAVSARLLAGDVDATGWLGRLGWTGVGIARSLTPGVLDVEGVGRLLEQAGVPTGAESETGVDPAAELVRITGGDPLVLQLYVEYLATAADRHALLRDLPSRPPGLDGYFDRWWQEQQRLWGEESALRAPLVRSILSLLAGAFGPLINDDLLELEPGLDSWMLEDAMRPLGRFVLGDGEQQGYSYSHPRLAAHFFERLAAAERRRVDQRFLDWGAGAVKAEAVLPAYVSEHYCAHLRRAGRRDALFELVHDRHWSRVQLASDPSGGRLVTDLREAWSTAEETDAEAATRGRLTPLLHHEVACALDTASIRSLSRNLPAAVIAAVVQGGRWTVDLALQAAQQNPDLAERARALAAVAELAPEPRRTRALQTALASVEALDNTSAYPHRRLGLTELAPHLSGALLDQAVALAKTAFDGHERVYALAGVLPHIPPEKQEEALEAALDEVRALPTSDEFGRNTRAVAFADLLPAIPESLRVPVVAEALETSRATVSADWRAKSFAWISSSLDEPDRTTALAEALAAVTEADWEEGKAQALEVIAPQLPPGMLREALDRARALSWLPGRPPVIGALAPHLTLPLVELALPEVESLEPSFDRSKALVALVTRLAEVGDPDRAIAAASDLDRSSWQGAALAAFAARLAHAERSEEALALVRKVTPEVIQLRALAELAESLPEPLRREAVSGAVAAAHADLTLFARLDMTEACDDFVSAALQLHRQGYAGEAVEVLRALPEYDSHGDRPRLRALAKALEHTDAGFRERIVDDALAAARSIGDQAEAAPALVALAALLPDDQRQAAEDLALGMTSPIVDPEQRGWVLEHMWPALSNPAADREVAGALAALASLDDPGRRAQLMRMLPRLRTEQLESLVRDNILRSGTHDEAWQAWLISRLATVVPDPVIPELIDRAQRFEHPEYRVEALAALQGRTADDLVGQLLDDVEALPAVDDYDNSPRAEKFAMVAEHLESGHLDRAMFILDSLAETSPNGWMQAIAAVAPRLAELGRGEDALAAVRAIPWGWRAGTALTGVLAYLPPNLLGDARAVLETLHGSDRRGPLIALVRRREEPAGELLLVEAAVAAATPDAWIGAGDDSDLLPSLMQRVPADRMPDVITRIRTLRPALRGRALALLAAHLPEPHQDAVAIEALDSIASEDDPDDRAEAIAAAAIHLPLAHIDRALEITRSVSGSKYLWTSTRAKALVALAPRLAALPVDRLYPLWRETLPVLASRTRGQLLWDLWALPRVLAALGGVDAVAGAVTALCDVMERWP